MYFYDSMLNNEWNGEVRPLDFSFSTWVGYWAEGGRRESLKERRLGPSPVPTWVLCPPCG